MEEKRLKQRKARILRKTNETDVKLELNLNSSKPVAVDTTIPFFDHMLNLMASHGNFSLKIKACGDTEVDNHHLIEDIGITLGSAFNKALGKKKGIKRYGSMLLPMDEALSYVSLDVSGRPYLDYSVKFKAAKSGFDFELLEDFFYAFAINARITLHISLKKGRSNHHIAESIFKALGRSLGQAVMVDSKRKGVPSTKGKL